MNYGIKKIGQANIEINGFKGHEALVGHLKTNGNYRENVLEICLKENDGEIKYEKVKNVEYKHKAQNEIGSPYKYLTKTDPPARGVQPALVHLLSKNDKKSIKNLEHSNAEYGIGRTLNKALLEDDYGDYITFKPPVDDGRKLLEKISEELFIDDTHFHKKVKKDLAKQADAIKKQGTILTEI